MNPHTDAWVGKCIFRWKAVTSNDIIKSISNHYTAALKRFAWNCTLMFAFYSWVIKTWLDNIFCGLWSLQTSVQAQPDCEEFSCLLPKHLNSLNSQHDQQKLRKLHLLRRTNHWFTSQKRLWAHLKRQVNVAISNLIDIGQWASIVLSTILP